MQALSCLLSEDVIQEAARTFKRCAGEDSILHYVKIYPLEIDEFVKNHENRCYICKKNVYSIFQGEMDQLNCSFLLDGTNVDDFNEQRPGFKAIQELNVRTPLLDSGLTKKDIRSLAKHLELENHDLPSNSCLATRIPTHTSINQGLLDSVEKAEKILKRNGFLGCRARISGKNVVLEIIEDDFPNLVKKKMKRYIISKFRTLGFEDIHLNLFGRAK